MAADTHACTLQKHQQNMNDAIGWHLDTSHLCCCHSLHAKSGIRTRPFRGMCHTCQISMYMSVCTQCPLCRGDDSQGHIFGSCMHPDMSKQYIARHDKAVRTIIQAFTTGQDGSCYLIADVGKTEGHKDMRVHSKRVPAYALPDRCLQARGLDPMVKRGFVQGGAADSETCGARQVGALRCPTTHKS